MKSTLRFGFSLGFLLFLFACSDSGNGNGGEESKNLAFKGNPPAYFNEVYLANADLKDEYDGDPAWVEFYNPADTAINLKGFYVSDQSRSISNASDANVWAFGDVQIPQNSYQIVFFSGRDKPNLIPASDSADLMENAVGAWSWADSESDTPGKSTAEFEFSKNEKISGTLYAADNSATLGWSTATVMLKFAGWNNDNVVDISNANQILLRGFITKNAKLDVRLAQPDKDDWVSWGTVLKGTGKENDLYIIELPVTGGFPDKKNIYGLRFANASNAFGEIKFSFNSIIARKNTSNIHASFELSKKGGKLFLIDSLEQIRDSVQYAAENRDLSFGRVDLAGEGIMAGEQSKWFFIKPPTPNFANSTGTYDGQTSAPSSSGFPKSGYYETELNFTIPEGSTQMRVVCDTAGALPNENSADLPNALVSGKNVYLTKTAIIRCIQIQSGKYPSEPIMRTYIIGERLPNLPVVSIAADPKDMFDSTSGIYATGSNASPTYPYFGANYWDDAEIPIQVDFFENGAKFAWNNSAGLQIFGNYSRANPKKSVAIGFREKYGQKNLKYRLFPDFPKLQEFKWFILRNNGGNYGKDYIRDMLMTSLTEGLGIDYQKGRAAIVYYNGNYFGIHNLRERSNGDYYETNYDIDENNIDLVKGNGDVSRGSDADFQNILSWLGETSLVNDEQVAELGARVDLDNFTNYMQSEMYFFNKDWLANNLKRWRTNLPPSKWKWFLYDTDFGFGGFDDPPGVKMFDFVTKENGPDYPNPPHSTIMIRRLFENENYRNGFINRFSLLLATQFAPSVVEKRINALMQPIADEIPLDQKRWKLNAASMDAELGVIRNFAQSRPAEMQREMEDFFGLGIYHSFTISKKGSGQVLVHNLPMPGEQATFRVYENAPLKIKTISAAGVVVEQTFVVKSDSVFAAEF